MVPTCSERACSTMLRMVNSRSPNCSCVLSSETKPDSCSNSLPWMLARRRVDNLTDESALNRCRAVRWALFRYMSA